jgi:hypothetical protein
MYSTNPWPPVAASRSAVERTHMRHAAAFISLDSRQQWGTGTGPVVAPSSHNATWTWDV